MTFGDQSSTSSYLTINNNSKLTIDDGSILTIYPNTNINLNGENAILEIKGDLVLKENATFSFIGSGHVVFSGDVFWHISAENNTTIEFIGSGTNDKVLEVKRNTLGAYNDNYGTLLSEFKVKNGEIEMGENARMLIGADYIEFNNVVVENLNEDALQDYRGLYLFSNNNQSTFKLRNITINNANHGIKLYLPGNSKTVNLQNIHINNTNEPLFTYGGGVKLTNLFIDGDEAQSGTKHGNGWVAKDMSFASEISGGFIKNNESNGIYYYGYAPSPLTLKYNKIYDNAGIGVYFQNSMLNAHCGTITGNGKEGIVNYLGTLELSPDYNKKGGYMDISDNQKSSVYTVGGNLLLNNGHNDLVTFNTNDYYDLEGSINALPDDDPQYISLTANYNQWYDPNTDPQNYTLLHPVIDMTEYIYLVDVNDAYYSQTNYTSPNAYCDAEEIPWDPDSDWWKYIYTSMVVPIDYSFPVINTTAFNNISLEAAIETAMDEMYNDSIDNFTGAIDKFYQILNYSYEDPDAITITLLDFAYDKMMEAVGKGVLDQQIDIERDQPLPIELSQVIAIQTKYSSNCYRHINLQKKV